MKNQIENLLLQNKTSEAKNIIFKEINANENPNAELYALLASTYAIEKKQLLAMQYFNKAYEIAPNNYEIVVKICNFLIANGDAKSANIFMERLNQNQQKNLQNEATVSQNDDDFSYADFILNDYNAISYEYNTNQTKNNSTVNKTVTKNPQNEANFNYSELILNDDLNVVLEKYDLPKLSNEFDENKEKIEENDEIQSQKNQNSPKIKPRMLFTMYGWNESGGGTVHPKAIITEFANRGYEVAVFFAAAKHSASSTPYFMERTIENGVKLYGIYNRPTIFLDADNPEREICDKKIITLFNTAIDEFQPNIINFHNFLGLSFEMATVAKSRNIVTTFTTHNYHIIDPKLYIYNNDLVSWKNTNFFENSDLPSRYPMLKDAYQKRIDKAKSLLLNEIDYIFAVSNRVKELLSEFCEISVNSNENRIVVINQIHNSINFLLENPIKNHQIDEKIRFAFIGDALPHKGAHLIPQALQFLTNNLTNSKISFDIWGDFDNEYGRAIKSIDKNNLITFRGKYSANDLRKIAEQSDIGLATSICEETGPLILSEFLAMNLPVIASFIGGVEDFIIDGFNGILYRTGSPKSLASAIQYLLENPFKIEKMRKNCKIPYSFSEYIDHLLGIYEILVSGERPFAKEFDLSFSKLLQ